MRLPDGKAAVLYCVYEALSNSLHAIEDEFGTDSMAEKGKIEVNVTLDDEKNISSISIRDNGTGLTPNNLKAFDTCDTRNKRQRGGKGIGRLIWIKVFQQIMVETISKQPDDSYQLAKFRFVPNEENSIFEPDYQPSQSTASHTQINLCDSRSEFRLKITWNAFVKDLALHFFSYFMTNQMPELVVSYVGGSSIELRDYIKAKILETKAEEIPLPEFGTDVSLKIVHTYVERRTAKNLKNNILLIAHNRLVEPIEIESKFALNKLPDGKAYVAVVSGKFLDERVDQERTSFKLTTEQKDILHRKIITSSEDFLTAHISSLREEQKDVVSNLLFEHPQLASKVGDIGKYVLKLSPSMADEEIGKTLFTLLYRDERTISKEVQRLSAVENLDAEAESATQKTLQKVTEQAKARLAEYVVKRKQIIELAKTLLRRSNDPDSRYAQEKMIHDLICPMGNTFIAGDYDAHNLWLVDDLLAYYSFFASDTQLRKIAPETASTSEPDLIFFNHMGFRREGTNDPVVLVEFKRPGDETTTSDPVDQVLSYIEKLRNQTVRHAVDGEVISEIRQETPFECFIVCDLTEGTRKMLKRSIAQNETPDGEGYYGYSSGHRAMINVVSYRKMLKDAELRNKVFFDKLGLEQIKTGPVETNTSSQQILEPSLAES